MRENEKWFLDSMVFATELLYTIVLTMMTGQGIITLGPTIIYIMTTKQ